MDNHLSIRLTRIQSQIVDRNGYFKWTKRWETLLSCFCWSDFRRSTKWAPTSAQCVWRFSLSRTLRTANPPAEQTGFPPNVLNWIDLLSMDVCMEILDVLYETEDTSWLFDFPCPLAASTLVCSLNVAFPLTFKRCYIEVWQCCV